MLKTNAFNNMIYFTKYAEEKFDILNKHRVFITKEQVEDALKTPDATSKEGNYFSNTKDNVRVLYKKEDSILKIFTFYPVK